MNKPVKHPKPAYSPTAEEKRLALRHIWYEIREGLDAGRLTVISLESKEVQSIIRNSAILSSHVHWRILAEFFSNRPEHDNVLAIHYDFNVEPLRLNPDVGTKINKTIAHLSYHRTTLTEPEWTYKVKDMGQPVLERCALFIRHLLDATDYVIKDPPDNARPWQQRDQWEALFAHIVIALQQIEARQERKPGCPPFSSTLAKQVRVIPGRHPGEPDAILIEGTTTTPRIG
jgi:hypothetical protein